MISDKLYDREPLEGIAVTFVIPHTPESVGYDSGRQFLSLAAYHDNICTIVSELGANTELIFLSDNSAPEWSNKYETKTESVTFGSSYGKEFSLPLYRKLAQTDADIVHVHGYNQLNVLPILASLATTESKVVVQNHGSALKYSSPTHWVWYQLLQFSFLFAVDVVSSVNENELKNLEQAGVDPEKLVHLPNAVDTDLFHPMDSEECRSTLSMNPHRKQLLFVGKINKNKGVSYLMRALSELPEDTQLTLVYSSVDEDEFARVKSILIKQELLHRVNFVGKVEQNQLAKYYNAADVSVFPSVNEGFGVVTLESMACGTPVVGTTEHASGGHLEHGENALIAEKESSSSLAENIGQLLASAELRECLGRRGIKTVQERYTWKQIGSKLANTYVNSMFTRN